MATSSETATHIIRSPQGNLSAIHSAAKHPQALFVLAHGAGAPMTHPFLRDLAESLRATGVSTLRFNFPYAEHGRRRPDHRAHLLATFGAVEPIAIQLAQGIPVFYGGKSMGGRMSSHALSEGHLKKGAGLIFVGFPLHPPGKEGVQRADHLQKIAVPMLFLQGTRDKLADIDLMRSVAAPLSDRATLHVVDGADHSFAVLKRSGRTSEEVLVELAQTVSSWIEEQNFLKTTS